MSATTDVVDAIQALAAALLAAAEDPADQVRLLTGLAAAIPASSATSTLAGDLCRRSALIALARAAAVYRPASYDEAVAVRDLVTGQLQAEERVAADRGQDATFQAFRSLRVGVARVLTSRAGNLARLRTVQTPTPRPALALAYRLYGDAARAGELVDYAQAVSPLFLPTRFRAKDR